MGKNLKISKNFQSFFLSEQKKRGKRWIQILGVFLFAVVMAGISYAIAEAVSESKVNTLREEMISMDNITVDFMNSTNELIENMDQRLTLLEMFSQVLEFADQNGQEAENLEKFLLPRLSNENDHHAQLDFDFQESLISQVLLDNKNLKPNELMLEVFKLKQSTSYFSWLENL